MDEEFIHTVASLLSAHRFKKMAVHSKAICLGHSCTQIMNNMINAMYVVTPECEMYVIAKIDHSFTHTFVTISLSNCWPQNAMLNVTLIQLQKGSQPF